MPLRRSILSRTFWRSFRDQKEALAAMAVADSEESSPPPPPISQESDMVGSWSAMLPELLGEIIRRVADREDQWPQRRDIVTCACVSKKWREITREIIGPQCNSGKIAFPSCLKLPGPQDFPNQCLIRRNKKTSTFYLHLTPSFTDKGKFLLAARRFRTGAYTEYIISLDADDFSQGSNAYVGKLRSDFLGTDFTIYDSQPPHSGAKPSSSRDSRRFASNQISPQVSSGNFEVGNVSYKRFKLIGPRRIVCSLKCPISSPSSSGDASPNQKRTDEAKMKKPDGNASGLTILKNRAPMWHEHLQCWGLEFHGRVTVASVKNFQLAATMDDESQPSGKGDEETVLLQFGKVGDDTFTMDYRQPLSAFQAFAICLSSFGTKFCLPVKK